MREPARRGRSLSAWAALAAMAWMSAAAGAEDARGWHVVRPGDTLEGITARYLGSPLEWRQNWALNPQVRDPDVLQPGERLRVLLRPSTSQPAAQLRNVRRQVDEMPAPIAWKPAEDEDLLLMHDGVRTSRTASAELAFTDGTRMRVDEDSLVFLRGEKERGGERDEIEIVRGQTDVEVMASSAREQVELVLGPARARARAGEAERGRMRARRREELAHVMVYSGAGDVAAAGSRVDLPAGTGSAVSAQGPPSPAEPLLTAPTLEHPAGGATLTVANPRFHWTAVSGASSYIVEFCADPACADILRRASAPEARWMTQDLPPRSYFWRVTAQSASGLDGFASEVAAFSLAGGAVDSAAPTVTLDLGGTVISRAGVRYVPAAVPLQIATSDDTGAVARWEAVVNDQTIAEAELKKPWKGGAYRAIVRAWDGAGNATTSAPLSFTVDDTPPTIDWQVAMPSVLRDHGAPMPLVGKTLRDASRAARREGAALSLTADGGNWTAVPTGQAGELWHALSQDPQLFVLAVDDAPLANGAPQLENGQLIRIHAADAGAGVERLDVSVETGADGASALKITARDRVGNLSSTVWPLRRR